MCSPTTALAFANVNSRLLLLVGEGPWLRVYEQSTRRLLCSKRVFDNQAVHGITSDCAGDIFNEHGDGRHLIWGGRSVCFIRVDNGGDSAGPSDLKIQCVVSETQVEDCILDACFRPLAGNSESAPRSVFEALLVTAHNVILHLHGQLDLGLNAATSVSISRFAVGPRSILYSAHIIWHPNSPGLVATGTVYGEILFWSFPDAIPFDSKQPISGTLHDKFTGHEGSVFGVRISGENSDTESGIPKRVIASCSDDRTIRIWDVSLSLAKVVYDGSQKISHWAEDGGFAGDAIKETSSSVATAMGHASRIWGLRFLCGANSNRYLLSLGEDTTAQVWQLRKKPHMVSHLPGSSVTSTFLLQHCSTHKFHSGKNIWASAAYQQSVTSNLVCTGGADGRVACFNVVLPQGDTLSSQWTFKEVLEDVSRVCRSSETNPTVAKESDARLKLIFTSLEGKWKLIRTLDSAIPTYPSGIFEGTALFEKRPPTSPVYDAEYLYIENGRLTTQQGLSLTANRRYVYRFQEKTNTISAWFVKPDGGSSVDYLFHKLKFVAPDDDASFEQDENRRIGIVEATGRHPCVDDDYQAQYGFRFREGSLRTWTLRYTVKGPKKDYIADAEYLRDDLASNSKNESAADRTITGTPLKINAVRDPEGFGNLLPKVDSFKVYAWVNEDVFLVLTDLGWLFAGNLRIPKGQKGLPTAGCSTPVFWERIAKIADLKYSCIAAIIRYHEAAIFAGASGTVHIYLHGDKSIHSPIEVPGKIGYMNSHLLPSDSVASLPKDHDIFEIGIIISCLGSSVTHFFIVEVDKRSSKCFVSLNTVLDRSPSFIVTSSCFTPSKSLLILGSRSGNLAIYDVSGNRKCDTGAVIMSSNLENRHGDDAITSIIILPIPLPNFAEVVYFLTAGRNGVYAIHRLDNNKNEFGKEIDFRTVHASTTPIGRTIEGACFDPFTKDLLLWGFRSKAFVLWNESQQMEIMISECGGAHRNWAFLPYVGDGSGGSLVWTQASTCNIHSQLYASHQVLQYGGHGREIKAMALSPPIKDFEGRARRYIATGAEDTTICIFDCSLYRNSNAEQEMKRLGIFSKHTTGIQQLRWSTNGQILFSAAGCEEFFVWRVTSIPCLEVGLVCEANCPPTNESDLRIMDFDVSEFQDESKTTMRYLLSMVYSDSSVRVSGNLRPHRCYKRLSHSN